MGSVISNIELKLILKIETISEHNVDNAINELSKNISQSDLISENGCIINGSIKEFIVKRSYKK